MEELKQEVIDYLKKRPSYRENEYKLLGKYSHKVIEELLKDGIIERPDLNISSSMNKNRETMANAKLIKLTNLGKMIK